MQKFIKSNIEPSKIDIGGQEYPVMFTFATLAELEEKTGKSFVQVFNDISASKFNSGDILQLLYLALKGGGVDATLDDLQSVEFTHDLMLELASLIYRNNKIPADDEKENADDADGSDGADKKKSAPPAGRAGQTDR